MVEQFEQNTLKEVEEIKTKILNQDTEAETLEENHRVEIKVYLKIRELW